MLLILLIPVSFASEINDVDNSADYSIGLEDSNVLTDYSSGLTDSNSLTDYSIESEDSNNNASVSYQALDESLNHEESDDGNINLASSDSSSNNLSENSISSSSLDSSSMSSSVILSDEGVRLADLNTSFTHFDTVLDDSNTVYINSSYTGNTELGTKLNPYKTVMAGISATNSSLSNVFIANGIYNISSQIRIVRSMNIIGESLKVILDGLNTTNLFKFDGKSVEVSIFNLTFRNGYANKGGALYIDESSLNLIGCLFENNSAYVTDDGGYAGAIYNDAGFLKMYNTSFINNRLIKGSEVVSEAYGGAIYNELGEMTIINSRFLRNSIDLRNLSRTSYGAGGAIFSRAGFVSIFNSTINDNSIYANYSLGGAISIWASRNVYLLNSTVNGNIISGNYGFASAISNKGTLLQIENSTISNNNLNASSVKNSTVFSYNGNFHLINTKMENNSIKTIKTNLLMCLEDQLITNSSFDLSKALKELNMTSLPSRYDLRDEGLVTAVKNQGSSGACWAFAFYSAMESYLLKYENISYDFSENNMKNIMGDGSENSTDWDNGGAYIMALAYLLRWSGAINETDDPFVAWSKSSPTNLTRVKYLTDVSYIPLRLGYLDNDQIKAAILKYGAVFVPVYSGIIKSGSLNGYSNVQTVANHAVAIVGWDDNYSASKFSNSPPGDGAFIIKNSWGTNGGEDGYYYISYYDASLSASIETSGAVAVTNLVNTTEYRNNYYYDTFGNTFESIGYNSDTIWFANRFTAVSSNPLSAFGLYTYGDSTYEISIGVNGKTVYTSKGSIVGAGYHTIKLTKLVSLSKGDIFNITVKLTTPGSLFPLAVETNYSGYTPRAQSDYNESFISPNGINWYDLYSSSNNKAFKFYEDMYYYQLKNANVCLKAYTAFADDLYIDISSNSTVYYTGDSIKLNITLRNDGDLARNISVPVNLDNSINISSYNIVINRQNSSANPHYSGSSFNKSNKTWTMNYLASNESVSLILTLKMNSNKNLTVSATANTSTLSARSSVAGNISLRYRIPTRFKALPSINTTARSYDIVNFTLLDVAGKPIANKNIILSLISSDNDYNMSNLTLKTNSNGVAQFKLNLTLGSYKFKALFNEDASYQSSEQTLSLNITKRKDTKIIYKNMTTYSVIESVDGRVGEYFNVTLKDKDNYILANKKIQIGFNGKVYNRTTDENGSARLQINLKVPNTYTFAICFLSDDDYYASFEVAKIVVVKKKMSLTVPNKSYKSTAKSKTLTATLKNNFNKVVSGKLISFTVNGKTYSAKTNSKGVASVNVSLSAKKTYSFTVKFAGDDYYGAVSKTGKVTIS